MTDSEYMAAYLQERRKTARKSRYGALKSGVRKLENWITRQGLTLCGVRIRDAEDYQRELLEEGYIKTTVAGCMAEAIVFYEYLKREKIVLMNPFREVTPPRMEKKLPRHIPKEKELAGLLEGLARFEEKSGRETLFVRYRSHLVAELLYSTGMRIGEAGRLRLEDVDLVRGTVTVRESKNGQSRVCFLSEYARCVLELYVNRVLPLLAACENGLLFGGEEMNLKKKTNQVLSTAVKKSGIGKITCHALRHAFGAHMLKAGCDIRYIQTFLGHSWLKTTQIYTKVEKEDLREVLDRCHPRNFTHTTAGRMK